MGILPAIQVQYLDHIPELIQIKAAGQIPVQSASLSAEHDPEKRNGLPGIRRPEKHPCSIYIKERQKDLHAMTKLSFTPFFRSAHIQKPPGQHI